jgi:uncharacterized protein with FMN-binding domain
MNAKKSQLLLTLGTAAGLAIYAAGYSRTEEAARRVTARRTQPNETPADVKPSVVVATQAAQAVALLPVAESPAGPAPLKWVNTRQGLEIASESEAPGRVVARFLPNPATGTRAVKEFLSEFPAATAKWADGRWSGWGSCPHGKMRVEIEIVGGRIAECMIAECYTNYADWYVRSLTREVVGKQSYNIGTASGATQSSDAFYNAVVEALQEAKKAAL